MGNGNGKSMGVVNSRWGIFLLNKIYGEKMRKGKKTEENYIKKRRITFKMHLFGYKLIPPRPPQPYFPGRKWISKERGGGEMIKMHNLIFQIYGRSEMWTSPIGTWGWRLKCERQGFASPLWWSFPRTPNCRDSCSMSLSIWPVIT